MAKPPASTPHSDIEGVHEDERPNTDVAEDLGQGGADLERAKDESVGRPENSDERSQDGKSHDDRSH